MTDFSNRPRLLAIAGSLRAQSANRAVLQAAAALAPPSAEIVLYGGLGDLPHFNPDLDTEPLPAAVAEFRAEVARARCLLICSPEYAHGVPGVMKNALDWLVSDEGFIGKPVALISARPGGDWAQASLRETLTVMNACLVEAACVTLPLATNRVDAAGLLAMPEAARLLRQVVDAMLRAVA